MAQNLAKARQKIGERTKTRRHKQEGGHLHKQIQTDHLSYKQAKNLRRFGRNKQNSYFFLQGSPQNAHSHSHTCRDVSAALKNLNYQTCFDGDSLRFSYATTENVYFCEACFGCLHDVYKLALNQRISPIGKRWLRPLADLTCQRPNCLVQAVWFRLFPRTSNHSLSKRVLLLPKSLLS